MIPRVRHPLEDSLSVLMSRSEILSHQKVDSKLQNNNSITKSTFLKKTSSNSRIPSTLKPKISTVPDLDRLRDYTSKGTHTNKSHTEPNLMYQQKENHNENFNILNRKKQYALEPEEEIISEAVTPDGKQLYISRALKGRLLVKATLEELNKNMNERKKIFPLLVPENTKLINYEPTKTSVKPVGVICSYAANTNQGISRGYNEDRVSIVLNITKKQTKCSFFAIYDGHGGSSCSDYLRDTLHDYIVNQPSFPDSPKEALNDGIKQAEQMFLKSVRNQSVKDKQLDRSGSCGIIVMVVGDECYVANVGDSRAILSADSGKFVYDLSRDHKPTDPNEQRRVQEAGGRIYRTQVRSGISNLKDDVIAGPLRVYPGKLSVSRTFGDIEAKDLKYGGNSKVVIVDPEIKHFTLKSNHDFIILGSDGIFDKMDSKDVVRVVWQTVEMFKENNLTIHQMLSVCVEEVLREVMNRRGEDNITVVMIAFKNFEDKLTQLHQLRNTRKERQSEQVLYRTK